MKLDEWQIQRLLRDHFEFYEDLRLKRRRPKSAAQRQFQDVAWGKADPKTEHEHAYVAYLQKHGITPSPKGTLATVAGASPGSIRSVNLMVTVGTSSIM